jgi:hypothetical protein
MHRSMNVEQLGLPAVMAVMTHGFMLFWAVLAVTIAALSLGPSSAHVLESIPRLKQWSPELWRETTVFNAQFWMLRNDRLPLRFSLAAT